MTTPPLQPGQYWRTRAGDIRYVAAVLPEWSGVQMPVIVLHNGGSGDIFIDQYTRQGGFLIYNRESDHDLITHLPECDSLDWAPATIEYPAYVIPASESRNYAYIRRDSPTSAEIVWINGKTDPYKWGSDSQEFIDTGTRIYITKEQAESRVHKPVPPLQKKYYKTGAEHFGYFLVDSRDTYFWITPNGREVRQDGSPDILTKHPFVEITKEEAETRVKKSDASETVIEINDSVLSMLNTQTALLINGEIAGLITEVEFGLMNDDIRQKTPVARQYLGVSVSPPEVLQPPVQTPESPEDWVDITDQEHVFRECDELSCCDSEFTSPVIWLGKKVGAFLNSPGQCHSYKVRCRRRDLPVKKSDAPLEDHEDWVPQESVPARIVDEYRWSNWPSGEWRGVTQSMERQGISSGARSLFMRGVTLSVRCRRKDHPSQQKQPVPHTAPEVWSLIEHANCENSNTSKKRSPFTLIDLLIRICSAQQSMLSELSAQVDALRSQIASGEPR